MRIQPDGGLHETWTKRVLVAKGVSVANGVLVCVCVEVPVSVRMDAAVNVAVGNSNEVVGAIGVGVACDGSVSARAREIPPITRTTETRAIMTPPPNCRKFCIISPLFFWRWVAAR